MKHNILILLVLLNSGIYITRADDFSDFRIPSHQAHNWAARFSGSGDRDHDNNLSNFVRSWQWNGELGSWGYWLWDSEIFRSELYGSGNASGQTQSHSHKSFGKTGAIDYLTEGNGQSTSEDWSVGGNGWAYPWHFPLGASYSCSGKARYQQSWDNSHQRVNCSQCIWNDGSTRVYDYQTSATLGAGWGRIRDASGVFDALLVEKRLKDEGVITQSLLPETRRALADFYYRRSDISLRHERTNRFFWQEVEKILQKDPAFKTEAWNAYVLHRLGEPFPVKQFLRPSGFFVGPVLSADHSHSILKSDYRIRRLQGINGVVLSDTAYSTRSEINRWQDLFSAGVQGEYDLPFGMSWQLSFISKILFPVNRGAHALLLDNQVRAEYILADRWRALATTSHSRSTCQDNVGNVSGSQYQDDWQVQLTATLQYYIEDHLTADLTVNHAQVKFTSDWNKYYYQGNHIQVGMTYAFDGAPVAVRAATSKLPRSSSSAPTSKL